MEDPENNIETNTDLHFLHENPSENMWSSISCALNLTAIIIFSGYVIGGLIVIFLGFFIYSSFIVKLILLFSILNLCYRICYNKRLKRKYQKNTDYFLINLKSLLSVLLFIGVTLHRYVGQEYIKYHLREDVPILSNASIRYIFEWQEGMHSGRERYIVATLKKEAFLSYIKQSEPVHPDHQVFNKSNYLYLNISPKSYDGYRISNQYEPYYLLYNPNQGNRIKFYIIKYSP